jgi:hypothetical protein
MRAYRPARCQAVCKSASALAARYCDFLAVYRSSSDAVPLGIEFMDACADLAEDFGYKIIERDISAVKNLIQLTPKQNRSGS